MLTARDQLAERVAGLDGGADDYLVKPFPPQELIARLRAVCRRSTGTAAGRLSFGSVEVDLTGRSAWLTNQRVELTAREWSVLEALVLRDGRIVSKSDLERLVLGFDGEFASNAIEVHVSALRRKLASSSSTRHAAWATASLGGETANLVFDPPATDVRCSAGRYCGAYRFRLPCGWPCNTRWTSCSTIPCGRRPRS